MWLPLASPTADSIVCSRYTNVGMFYLRQVSFAAFDLRVHLSERESEAVREFRSGVG